MRNIIFIALLMVNLSACSSIKYQDKNKVLPEYFYTQWIHSYEGKSHYTSKLQIYRRLPDIQSPFVWQMRYLFNKDGSCQFWDLNRKDEYYMETCQFRYENGIIHLTDPRTWTHQMKPLKIIEISKDKLVVYSHHIVP
jgi:hypothetical protein